MLQVCVQSYYEGLLQAACLGKLLVYLDANAYNCSGVYKPIYNSPITETNNVDGNTATNSERLMHGNK